jgi:cytochrome b-561
LSSVAIYLIFKFHQKRGYTDLYSIHSIVGLTAFIAFGVQYVAGVYSFYVPKLPDGPRATFLGWHKYFGIIVFVLTYTAMLTGILDRQRITWNGVDSFTEGRNKISNALGMFILISASAILFHYAPAGKQKVKTDSPSDPLLP